MCFLSAAFVFWLLSLFPNVYKQKKEIPFLIFYHCHHHHHSIASCDQIIMPLGGPERTTYRPVKEKMNRK